MASTNVLGVSPDTPGKLAKELAFPFLIAAKAAILDKPQWLPSESWWNREGDAWLKSLAERVEIPLGSLPVSPTPLDVSHFVHAVPPEKHSALVLSVLSLCLLPNTSEKAPKVPLNYSAASRAFLSHALSLLSIKYEHLLAAEDHVAQGLYHELKDAEMKAKSEEARKEQEQGWGGKWGRVAATVGGVILGGVAIGVTGGLAAPALLPLIPFLSAASAPVVMGTLFGLTGGGLAGLRVNKRWAGVDKFDFIQVVGGGEQADPSAITHWYTKTTHVVKAQAPSLLATVIVPGIMIKNEAEGVDSVKACTRFFSCPRRDTFALSHSPSVMLATGKALHDWVSNQLLGKLKGEVIKRTALQTVFSVVALPLTVYKTTGMVVDNEWVQGCDRAKKAGRLLAEVLRDKVQGERPVVLIGSSLGALVVFEALRALAEDPKTKGSPLIDTAIFISLPAAPSSSEWSSVRGVVGRRVVNAYCSSDYVLAGVGRLYEVLSGSAVRQMAGLAPVKRDGVDNVDLSTVITGHFDLNPKMGEIFEIVGVND